MSNNNIIITGPKKTKTTGQHENTDWDS